MERNEREMVDEIRALKRENSDLKGNKQAKRVTNGCGQGEIVEKCAGVPRAKREGAMDGSVRDENAAKATASEILAKR